MSPTPSETTAVRDALSRALDALSRDERLVVTLRFHGDLTVPQVATLTGVPEGTVKSRLHHAMAKLRTVLAGGGPMSDLPMPDANDARLERALRDLLADREPGAAPYALRDRVDRVPDRARPRRAEPGRVAAGVIGTVAVAAAAVIVVVALGDRAAIDATGVGASPAPGHEPLGLGPGIVGTRSSPNDCGRALVVLGCLAAPLASRFAGGRRASVVVARGDVRRADRRDQVVPPAGGGGGRVGWCLRERDRACRHARRVPGVPARVRGRRAVRDRVLDRQRGPLPIRVHGIVGSPGDGLRTRTGPASTSSTIPRSEQTAASGRPFEPVEPRAWRVGVRPSGGRTRTLRRRARQSSSATAGGRGLRAAGHVGGVRRPRVAADHPSSTTSLQITAPTLTDCVPAS